MLGSHKRKENTRQKLYFFASFIFSYLSFSAVVAQNSSAPLDFRNFQSRQYEELTTSASIQLLAARMLYENVIQDLKTVQETYTLTTSARTLEFANCMLEHRSSRILRDTPIWRMNIYLANIVQREGLADRWWTISRRQREIRENRFIIYYFDDDRQIAQKSFTTPNSLMADVWLTGQNLTRMITMTGFSDPMMCLRPEETR